MSHWTILSPNFASAIWNVRCSQTHNWTKPLQWTNLLAHISTWHLTYLFGSVRMTVCNCELFTCCLVQPNQNYYSIVYDGIQCIFDVYLTNYKFHLRKRNSFESHWAKEFLRFVNEFPYLILSDKKIIKTKHFFWIGLFRIITIVCACALFNVHYVCMCYTYNGRQKSELHTTEKTFCQRC